MNTEQNMENLLATAETIRTNTLPDSNTAQLVGQLLKDLLQFFDSVLQLQGSNLTDLSQQLATLVVDNLNSSDKTQALSAAQGRDLLLRLRGMSDNSIPYEDPFKLVRFTGENAWNEFLAWLDELHTSDGTPDNQKAGFFRVNINGIQYEVHNLVLSWSVSRFIQVLIGVFDLNDDGTLKSTGRYSIVQRKYDNGKWTDWDIDTVDGRKGTVGIINIEGLDAMFGLAENPSGMQNIARLITGILPSRWTVVDNSFSASQSVIVGTMDVFSDNLRHQFTQVFATHYVANEEGTAFVAHTDQHIRTYFRSFGFSSSSIAFGQWTPWRRMDVGQQMYTSGEVFNDYTHNNASDMAHAEGESTHADGIWSHTEGKDTIASGTCSHAEGFNNKAEAHDAHAEGSGTHVLKTALQGHSEGRSTIVSGECGHAEGAETNAGPYAHTEGVKTYAGDTSHAEGYQTNAPGRFCHAEGFGTKTTNDVEHAEGSYNASHEGTKHSIGIGTSDTDRKNAFEVMSDGRVFAYGIGDYNGNNPDAARSLQQCIFEKSNNFIIIL